MLPQHRSHDYPWLIRRWKSLARAHGLRCQEYASLDELPLFVVTSRRSQPDLPNIYLSAGIHGDESGATEGLLAWAEANTDWLPRANFTLLPCLNPWGLINNCRYDAHGHDLNRSFHLTGIPAIEALKTWIARSHYQLAMTLHEDFDGQGLYFYEVWTKSGVWGPALLSGMERIIPIDARRSIEGRRTNQPGYLCRNPATGQIVLGPEALYLHEQGAEHIFTVETPSEFSLDLRIAAHVELTQRAVRRAITGDWKGAR